MDTESFRKAGHEAIDAICDYYETLSQRPVMAQVEPGFLSHSIQDDAPEDGEEWSNISKDFQDVILPGMTHWQHPSFFAYFPANATFEGMLADLYAASLTHPGFNWAVSPSNTELELTMLNWMARIFGLSNDFLTTSDKGGAIILGTASEVAITVAVAARERALLQLDKKTIYHGVDSTKSKEVPATETAIDPEALIVSAKPSNGHSIAQQASKTASSEDAADWRGKHVSKMVIYGTTQTHTIGVKAANILGLQFRAIEVEAKDAYALRGNQLRKALEEDTAKGLIPFMLIATVGSTSSGAIDNLVEIEQVVKDYPRIWIHVDAAWAGVAYALPEFREVGYLDTLNSVVDSFSTNMHKWGLVPFDCAPLWVRERASLSNALTVTPEYLRTKQGDAGSALDLRNMQLFLGRRFRSLKVWFVLRSYGQKGFREHLRTSISHSRYFNKLLLEGETPFEIVAPPQLALTVFRLRSREEVETSTQRLDAINRALWDELQNHNDEVLLTQTLLPEIGFCIRMAIGSPQTRKEDIERAYQILCECARIVTSAR